ncbi:hypothetical protein EDC04DRAFT_2988063 [Pisolithus marmoratus]|nr:hypothetical protein EDC04DRAFT_2988063 [Pisolithus marmoratus]
MLPAEQRAGQMRRDFGQDISNDISFFETPSQTGGSLSHRSLALRRVPTTPLLSSQHEFQLQSANSVELESQMHSLHGELVTTKELFQQLLEHISLLSSASPTRMNISDPFLILLQQVRQDDTAPYYSADELPNIKYFWKADFLRDHRNGRGYLKTVRNNDSGTIGFLEDRNGIVTSKDEQQRFRDYARPLLYCLQKFGYAPSTWTKVSAPALEFFARSMRIRFESFRYCADNWKADMFMSLYYSGWAGRSRDSESASPDTKEESSTPTPNEVASRKRPQSITLPLSTQLTKKKKEGQDTPLVAVSASSSDPSSIDPELDSPVGAIQDEETVDTTEACPPAIDAFKHIKILPVVPSPHIDPSLIFEPPSTTATVIMNVQPTIQPASEVSVFQQLLGGLDAVETMNDGRLRFDASASSIEAIPGTAIAAANPKPGPVAGSGIGGKKKRNAPDKNSTMRASQTSTTPRNLCAIDWCKEHKGGTVGEFSEYWDTLVRNNDSSVDNYKRQAAMVKEMRKKVLESTSPVAASEHAFEGYRDV